MDRVAVEGAIAGSDWRELLAWLSGLSNDQAEEASKNCAWARRFAWTDDEVAFPQLVHLLLARGTEFAHLAAATPAPTARTAAARLGSRCWR